MRGQEGTQLIQVPVRRLTADIAQSGPAFFVPSGAVVEVSPLSANANDAFFSMVGADAAKAGTLRTKITSTGLPRRVTVRNLADIWTYSGTIGEGLLFSVLYP